MAATVGMTGSGARLPGGMMIPDNGDGPWIQGQAHLWAKMRSGGGDDAQRAGDAQSWPGRLHGPPPPSPRPGRVQEPGEAGTTGAPAPAPRSGAMDSVSGPETPQPPGTDSPAPPLHLLGWA